MLIDINEFDQIFKIMEKSFPKGEFRKYQDQKALFNDPKYNIIVQNNSEGDVVGFLSFWVLDNLNFIEHIAVRPDLKGRGVGSCLVNKYLYKYDQQLTVLEVEIPSNEVGIKRIEFYKKLKFNLNMYYYNSPTLCPGTPSIPMYIMSYPKELDFIEFIKVRETLYKNIY